MRFYPLIRPLLFLADAEKAHLLVASLSRLASQSRICPILLHRLYSISSPRLASNVLDIEFPNPVGIAAGFDKNGYLVDFIESLGFGFIEVGSVTNHASNGNPRPRLFRLPEDQALINRMGLNNVGPSRLVANLDRQNLNIPVGINIAKTNSAEILEDRAIEDIVACYEAVSYAADYTVLNLSCPNAKDGRTFENPNSLEALLVEVFKARSKMDTHEPLLVKFSADMPFDELDSALEVCEKFPVRGYILCNTTITRENLHTSSAQIERIGRGGLSGLPLQQKALERVSHAFRALGRRKPIIGCGGVNSAESAYRFIRAGASLVQLYTGLIYRGPSVCREINQGLLKLLDRDGFLHVKEAIGVDVA